MAQKELGFGGGVRAFFGGAGFLAKHPSMWGWAAVPAVVAAVLFFGLGALALLPADALALHLIGGGESAWATAGLWTLRIVFALIGIALSFLVATTLAQPLAGFALDVVARRQELALGGRRWPDQPRLASALRSLRVSLTALAVSLPVLGLLSLVTFAFPPASVVTIPLKFLVTGLAVAYDFLDYPLSLRGHGVGERLAFIRRHFAAVLGFGVAGALFLLIPGIGLFLLPVGVAGATRLVAEASCRGMAGRATTGVHE